MTDPDRRDRAVVETGEPLADGELLDAAPAAEPAATDGDRPARWSLVSRARFAALRSAQKVDEWVVPMSTTDPWR